MKRLLIFILILAIFFRFFNLSSWFHFGMDQEYEALIVKNIVEGRHFPLIGVNAADTGLYLGPAFIYASTVPFFLSLGNPLAFAAVASAVGVATTYLIFRVAKHLFGRRVGLLASLFYGGSFLAAFYDRKFWNPTPIPFFSLVIVFLLYQIKKGDQKKLIFLSLIFGLALQSHLSILIFLLPIVYVLWVKRKIFSQKVIVASLSLFLFLQLPLILFDLRHNLLNTRTAVNLVLGRSSQVVLQSTLSERGQLFLSSLGRFFWTPIAPDLMVESGQCGDLAFLRKESYPETIIFVLILTGLFFFFARGNLSAIRLIKGITLLSLVFVLFYKRAFFEYYFVYLFPWLAIILAVSVDLIWQRKQGKYIAIAIIVLFVMLNLFTFLSSRSSYSYEDKRQAINFAKKHVANTSYSLEAVGQCPRFGGYRYLFEYFIKSPTSSYMDSYFDWLYKKDISQALPQRIVLLSLIDPRADRQSIAKWEREKLYFLDRFDTLTKEKFGQIGVYILKPRQ